MGTSRSTGKLKPLHGAIAQDIAERLGEKYQVFSQGYKEGREALVPGRYYGKRVDIAIRRGERMVCGIAVKFVMQNYSQNSNNYFENMLGETANIRSGNCPYFQIFIILDKLPYYRKDNTIAHWETFSGHNAEKYLTLSRDDTERYLHTPNKTLVCVVHVPDGENITTLQEYLRFYASNKPKVEFSRQEYGQLDGAVILNDYETFVEKVYHTILSL